MRLIPRWRIVMVVGVALYMITAVVSSAYGTVVLGIYGGGTLSPPVKVTSPYSYQPDESWSAGSHIGGFIQFYSQKDHLGLRFEFLQLNYIEETYNASNVCAYFGASLEYSLIWRTTQRLIPFFAAGLIWHPYINIFGGSYTPPSFPPEFDLKADLGLKLRVNNFLGLRAQLVYAMENKLLAASLGIDLSI